MSREQNYLLVRLMDRLLLNVQRAELSVSNNLSINLRLMDRLLLNVQRAELSVS